MIILKGTVKNKLKCIFALIAAVLLSFNVSATNLSAQGIFSEEMHFHDENCSHVHMELDGFLFASANHDIDEYTIVNTVRVFASEHIYGEDLHLDELFDAGNSFVDVITAHIQLYNDFGYPIGGNFVREYVPSSTSLLRSNGCSFGNHLSPVIVRTEAQPLHFSHGFTGGHCIFRTVNTGHCTTCNAFISETISVIFVCWQC